MTLQRQMRGQATGVEETLAMLATLSGRWHGSGSVTFPTISRYESREWLRFEVDPSRPLLLYEHRTEAREAGAALFRPSHWETGFLRVTRPGIVQLSNAQNSGRCELCEMTCMPVEGGFRLTSTAMTWLNDPRLVGGARTLQLVRDEVRSRFEMATSTVPAQAPHLSAVLYRESD